MEIKVICQFCGKEFLTTLARQRDGRGKFCSVECRRKSLRKSEEQHLATFVKKYGKTPQELTREFQKKKITQTMFSKLSSIPIGTLSKDFKKFGVIPHKKPLKNKSIFICENCGKEFRAYKRPSRTGRNIYCSLKCTHESKRKEFQEDQFQVSALSFFQPLDTLGNYDLLEMGVRQKSFVNKNKYNHFLFKDGINSEEKSYVFGVLLTDGNIGRTKNGSYTVSLQLTDRDIIDKISRIFSYKNRIYEDQTRGAYKILMTSPYLYNDLEALGCGERKTYIAKYPHIHKDLDRHFIRGVIDGDGSWIKRSRTILSLQFCGHDNLLFGVYKKIKEHLKVAPENVQYPLKWDKRIKMKTFCHMRYNSSDSIKIRDWMYQGATIYGKRKYKTAISISRKYTDSLNTTKLANILGVAPDFIKKNIRKHKLPHEKVGPYYIFNESQKNDWIDFLKSRLIDTKCKFPNKKELIEKWFKNHNS